VNERIIEMAKQCGDWTGQTLAMNDVGIAKFAELIVRECLAQADALRDALESEGEDQQSLGAAWVGLAIARHFGVKE
jgi:hypothetical protein